MTADLGTELRRICEFIGASARGDDIRASVDASTFEKMSGGRQRGAGAHVRKGVVSDWRLYFATTDALTFNRVAANASGLGAMNPTARGRRRCPTDWSFVRQATVESGVWNQSDTRPRQSIQLARFDVFGARTLGSLSLLERHRLPFAQLVETAIRTRGLVKEVFGAVGRRDESETLVANQPLDRAIHR
jgi:hypothetical protein